MELEICWRWDLKAINRLLILFLLALPAWGACRSAASTNSYLDSNTVTTWKDASFLDGTAGWSQNTTDADAFEFYMWLSAGAGETEAENVPMLIHQSSGKVGLHEYGAGSNELTTADTFCGVSNSCAYSAPTYGYIVVEKISATKTYNVDDTQSLTAAFSGASSWEEAFSQTYTNEHTGGTGGIQTRLSWPNGANWANFWFYRGSLPMMLQRATVYGFYPRDAANFFLIPCTNWDRPGMLGAVPFTYTVVNGPFQQPSSPPPAQTIPMWNTL